MNMTPLTPPPEYGQYPSDECQDKIDALVDNVSVGDLRVILRHLLASSDVGTSERFILASQSHLLQTCPKPLPAPNSLLILACPSYPGGADPFGSRRDTQPSPLLYRLASRTRMLYASGLLCEAIQTILCIVQTSMCPGAQWWDGSDLAELYRRIDEDIVCVIHLAMEQVYGLRQAMNSLRTPSPSPPRGSRKRSRTRAVKKDEGDTAEEYLDLMVNLGTEMNKVQAAVAAWNGNFPFPKGASALARAVSRS
ncbi:hypothetical protein FRC07_013169 [Ceratobasidium sp. 392]|nr:hypothetical protein FRC07_013169 [Ceratobasidium sp. 392]